MFKIISALCLSAFFALLTQADITVPNLFGDHMALQR
jgi:hypothetical protein